MKKLLCALLCLCLLSSAAAAAFSDAGSIRNPDAVALMGDLGLVAGYEDGTFRPRNNIRRAEAAKLAALICQKDPQAAPAAFSDVAKGLWAERYIGYCAQKGIMVGAHGHFRPHDYVTARELAKILLVCIGYKGETYTGPNWKAQVDADAEKLSIYRDFTAGRDAYISRDNACLLMYNAMQCFAVSGGNYVVDQLMNPVTYMEHRFGVVKFSGLLEANEYADLTKNGGRLEEGLSKLQGHMPFRVSTSYEMLGRVVEIYTLPQKTENGTEYKVLGLPHTADTDQVTRATDESGFLTALRYSGMELTDATRYYYNGDTAGSDLFARVGRDCVIAAADHNSDNVLDYVMVTDFTVGTVMSLSPLTVSSGDTLLPGGFLYGPRTVLLGQSVRCAAMGGRFLID